MNRERITYAALLGGGLSFLACCLLLHRTYSPQEACALASDLSCPESSPLTQQSGAELQRVAERYGEGGVYNEAESRLQLGKQTGSFQGTQFSTSAGFITMCAADFDEDGWTDFVGGSGDGSQLGFYRNLTFENQQGTRLPRWSDLSYRTEPKFASPKFMERSCRGVDGHLDPDPDPCPHVSGGQMLSCADFNGDGHADFFYARSRIASDTDVTVSDTTRADVFLGRGDGTFERRYRGVTSMSSLDYLPWGMMGAVYDYNGDSALDLIIGHSIDNRRAAVHVYLSDGDPVQPRFTRGDELLNTTALGLRGAAVSGFGDMDGDGLPDLVVSGQSAASVWFHAGLAGGGVSPTGIDITGTFPGAATILIVDDFTLDGKLDIVGGSDNWNYNPETNGGYTGIWENNGTGTPFSGGITGNISLRNEPYIDLDVGVALNYDNDPAGTMDVLIADGNHSAGYSIFANRPMSGYNKCGDVQSGILDLGDLRDKELVVTGGRLQPDLEVPADTSVTFYMSNEDPTNWYQASACVDDSSAYCVAFPNPVGRSLRWKAELCSNRAQTETPSIAKIGVSFDYTEAREHYRSGVVVRDGVAYVGAFKHPGEQGHFYAISAGLTETYWDLAATLDSMSDADRHVYTATVDGTSRLDFTSTNASNSDLQATLGVSGSSQAESVINWQRSARFGINTPSRLGAIESSTPAIISPPSQPAWYADVSLEMRQKVDSFIAKHADRPTLILVGSKDGALHAVRNDPSNIRAANNGREAWAYIPAKVARAFVGDQNQNRVTSYPDGSPTVADVILRDGAIHTVALVAGGNGGRSIFAIDVTQTIDASNQILGPTPMWEVLPGGANAGEALSKPVIARVQIDGVDRFIAILASGRARENLTSPYTKGREVVAVDINDGSALWHFQSACPVTSDIVVFETDDAAEPGAPAIDGYIDRAMWADACGNLYKVNPGVDVAGDFIDSSKMGTIATGHVDPSGNDVFAVFSTASSKCALGRERPIYGTLGARSDVSGRMAVFLGTGGSEDYDPTLQNDFYVVYADTGEIRGCAAGRSELGRVQGKCVSGVCEKFYGGVVVGSHEVLVTRSTDRAIGTGTCEFGESYVTGLQINSLDVAFSVATRGATVSSLYGNDGSIYFATMAGEVMRIGTPTAANAGEGSTVNGNGGDGSTSDAGTNGGGGGDSEAIHVLSWRQIL